MAFRSITTLAPGTRTNSTLTPPSGLADGDWLLFLLSTGGPSAVAASAPSGFTGVAASPLLVISKADPWTVRGYAWLKLASGESGSYTATHSSAVTNGALLAFSGRHGTTPVNPSPSTNMGTGSTSTATGLTVGNDTDLIFFTIGWDGQGGAAPTGSTPTFTEQYDSGPTGVIYVATGNLASGAATGDKSNTNGNSVTEPWAAALIALAAPAGGGGGGSAVPKILQQLAW